MKLHVLLTIIFPYALSLYTIDVSAQLPSEPCTHACTLRGDPIERFTSDLNKKKPTPPNTDTVQEQPITLSLNRINQQKMFIKQTLPSIIHTLKQALTLFHKGSDPKKPRMFMPNPISVREDLQRRADRWNTLKKRIMVVTPLSLDETNKELEGSQPLLNIEKTAQLKPAEITDILKDFNLSQLRWPILVAPDESIAYLTNIIETTGIIPMNDILLAQRMLHAWLEDIRNNLSFLPEPSAYTPTQPMHPQAFAALRTHISPAHTSTAIGIILLALFFHYCIITGECTQLEGSLQDQLDSIATCFQKSLRTSPKTSALLDTILKDITKRYAVHSPSQATHIVLQILLMTFLPQAAIDTLE